MGLQWYNFHARQYDPQLGRFHSADPMAHARNWVSPYNFVQNNPISRTDPTGMLDGEFINQKGEKIGNDGKEDGKVYVMNTSASQFTEDGKSVPGAGLSSADVTDATNFITQNSGNTAAFDANPSIYSNFTEIEGSRETRQAMLNSASADNGKGGTSPNNNREYNAGIMPDGSVIPGKPGNVSTPAVGAKSGPYPAGSTTGIHSHPSGTKGPPHGPLRA